MDTTAPATRNNNNNKNTVMGETKKAGNEEGRPRGGKNHHQDGIVTPIIKNLQEDTRRRSQKSEGKKALENNYYKNRYNNTSRDRERHRLKVYHSSSNADDNHNTNSSSFWQMHKDCKAFRYKVYAPRSDCRKIMKLVGSSDDAFLKNLQLEDGRIDALVVIPDSKINCIYVCQDTSLNVFEKDPRKAEIKLRDEMFTKNASDNTDIKIDETNFKVSCASCLLHAHEPNGFCLVASPSADVIYTIRDISRWNRRKKERSGHTLHQDHAHFVATLPRLSLWNLRQSKTHAQSSAAMDEILGHLSNQDISVNPEMNKIELGYHLTSVLGLTKGSEDFWFVMGFNDSKSLQLDLPGGKRHLGETSLEGAIREAEEETSLIWDASWVKDILESSKPSEKGNRYFDLCPTESSLSG